MTIIQTPTIVSPYISRASSMRGSRISQGPQALSQVRIPVGLVDPSLEYQKGKGDYARHQQRSRKMSGAMIAVHAAVAANAAREKIADAFRVKGATAPERAVSLDQLGVTVDEKVLGEFIDSGVIRGVDSRGRLTVIGDELRSPKAYYFDEVTFLASRDNKKQSAHVRTLLIGLAIALGLVGAGLVAMLVRS